MMNGLAWFGLGVVLGIALGATVTRDIIVEDEAALPEIAFIELPHPRLPASQGQADPFWHSVGRC